MRAWLLAIVTGLAVVATAACGGDAAPARTAKLPAKASGDPVAHLRTLLAITERAGGTRAAGGAGERAASAYVAARLRAAGYRVTVQRLAVRTGSGARRSRNVIAEQEGSPARIVMAGAHIDSVPAGPGANDNASGVAAVLAVAERLGGRSRPGTGLRVAFWGAEEVGLVGSRRYVRGLSRAQRQRIAAYVNLDMVGSPRPQRLVYGEGEVLSALRRALPHTRFRDDSSDNQSFADVGIPVGGLWTGDTGDGNGDVPDPCFHRRCDTLDNVNLPSVRRMTNAVERALVSLSR